MHLCILHCAACMIDLDDMHGWCIGPVVYCVRLPLGQAVWSLALQLCSTATCSGSVESGITTGLPLARAVWSLALQLDCHILYD